VNEKKSAVARAVQRKFLGFSFFRRKGKVLIRVADQAVQRLRAKLRKLTRRTRSGRLEDIIRQLNEYLRGWMGYFRLTDTPSVFAELDEWLRRRLRQLLWKRWKRGRTRWQELISLGVPRNLAALGATGKSPWHMAATPVVHMALSNAFWQAQGLSMLTAYYHQLHVPQRTAGCGPACPVV
jgi:AcrR family transcriptional regulator